MSVRERSDMKVLAHIREHYGLSLAFGLALSPPRYLAVILDLHSRRVVGWPFDCAQESAPG